MSKWFRSGISLLLAVCMIVGSIGFLTANAAGSECDHTYNNGFCSQCDGYEPAVLKDGVYEIANGGQLYWFAEFVNDGNGDADVALTADITVNQNVLVEGTLNPDEAAVADFRIWTSIGYQASTTRYQYYTGTFDGQGYTVSGLYYQGDSNFVGLFGCTDEGAVIRNVSLENSWLRAGEGVGYVSLGGIVGRADGTTIADCSNESVLVGDGNAVGGVVGEANDCIIKNCHNTGAVSGISQVGGIAGTFSGSMEDCLNTGAVTGSENGSAIGGVVGNGNHFSDVSSSDDYYAYIIRCGNTGTVRNGYQIGGVLGTGNFCVLEDCFNIGAVTGSSELDFAVGAGGVIGDANRSCTLRDCYNAGAVTANYSSVGGIMGGNIQSTASNCFYLAASETDSISGTTFKTEAQFASGEVAWLLNGSTDQGDLVWYQTIGTDTSPFFDGAVVHHDANAEAPYFNDPHTHVYDQEKPTKEYLATPADCENAATYYYSCECGEKGEETFAHGEALGHDYGEARFSWNADYTATATVTCANDETHKVDLEVTVTTQIDEGDCTKNTVTTYVATAVFGDKTYTDAQIVEGERGEHSGDANKDHNCDKCGKPVSECADADKNHKCDVCGKVLSECVDENKDYKCDICGAELEKPEEPVIEDVIRLAGANRWETSLKVADEMKANLGLEKFDSIIIASGNDFADALAGSYLSTVKNAPILLGWGKGGKYVTLDEANIAYIKANLAEGGTVYILGGKNAVPELYETELKGYNVKRLGGANRFETNLLILEEAGVAEGSEVLVCTSTNFADSLSASATAKPILLVFNEYGKLYGKQPDFLAGLKNCTFTVIGGESAVSEKLATEIAKYGKVERLAGANRFETSVLVAQKYFKAPETAVLAYAWNYPDGLCGGSLAYSLKAPLILTMTKYEAKAVEYAKNAGIEIGLVLGGDTLISDDAVRAIFAMDAAGEIVKK